MKIKRFKKSGTIPVIIISSTAIGLIAAAVMILFSAFLISKNDIPPQIVRYFWVVVYFICGTVSGLVAGRLSKSKGFLWGFITSVISSVILVIVSAILLNFNLDIFIALLIPVSAVSGTLSGIISANLR